MQHIADLLAAIPLPPDPGPDPQAAPTRGTSRRDLDCDARVVHDLGADLPCGHLHVWGGPPGAGKTAFLLTLLYGAASRGRRVVYASYDLAPASLALRLLAMAAGVRVDQLPDPGGPASAGGLHEAELARVRSVRRRLAELPLSMLPARGFSTDALADRLVRVPFRPEVLAVDYLQGVIREPGTDLGVALRALSDMAERLHVAVICAVRAEGGAASATDLMGPAATTDIPDRVGWIAPAQDAGASHAAVIRNRHGAPQATPLAFDTQAGGFHRADA